MVDALGPQVGRPLRHTRLFLASQQAHHALKGLIARARHVVFHSFNYLYSRPTIYTFSALPLLTLHESSEEPNESRVASSRVARAAALRAHQFRSLSRHGR